MAARDDGNVAVRMSCLADLPFAQAAFGALMAAAKAMAALVAAAARGAAQGAAASGRPAGRPSPDDGDGRPERREEGGRSPPLAI